jgi:parallel beta-helix repeat protein
MKLYRVSVAALCVVFGAGCNDDGDGGGGDKEDNSAKFPLVSCATIEADHCREIEGGDVKSLQEAANSLDTGTTLVLGIGTFAMTNQLTIRSSGTHLLGQGMEETILDFAPTVTQGNGVDVIGNDFLVQDLTVKDARKDGIRVEASSGVVFRRIRATWSKPADPANGAYGIYPVKSENVLVEDSYAEHAADAGLYVGQCRNVIVRNNEVRGNVAGLEIENTQYADVYGNLAEDNTAGIVVFDLPGNPIVGRDVRIRDNVIRHNNTANFAPGGTVRSIPAGTGTFAMASRRVEITGNEYADNDTGDIAILSGLVADADTAKWELDTETLVGEWSDLDLLPGEAPDTISNFRSENILIANNSHTGSGTKPDLTDPGMLGMLFALLYGPMPVDSVLYDAIGESSFDSSDASKNSNDNRICVGDNPGGSLASLNLAAQQAGQITLFFRPAAPFAPFDCTTLTGGAVKPVVLP